MKRYGNLYSTIVSFENLWQAARHAQRGKRYRGDVLPFNFDIEEQLWARIIRARRMRAITRRAARIGRLR